MSQQRVLDIDLSRHVRRLRIIRLTDYAVVYASVQFILSSGIALVFDHREFWGLVIDVLVMGVGACCFVIGVRNIGTISSRTWTAYSWLIALLVPICLVMAALGVYSGASDPDTQYGTAVFALGAIWGAVTLLALRRLRSMKFAGIDTSLGGLAKSMADDGRSASTPIDFSRIERVNRIMGFACGALGVAVLIASAYGYHELQAMNFAKSISEVQNTNKAFFLIDCIGYFLLIRMRRYFQIDATALLRVDSRPPVLFLRSFEDDEKLSFAQSGEALFDYSLEMRLSRHFMHFGPFVAIGSPQDELPLPGAARMRLSDADWKGQVERWMSNSQVILMYCGTTFWVSWELGMLAQKGMLHKVLLLFPPRRGWAQRSKKVVDDIKKRLTYVKGALKSTPWAEAAAALQPDANLRALLFRPDGTLTAIRCQREDREAYHLAALVGHYILRGTKARVALCLRASSSKRWPVQLGTTRIGAGTQNDITIEGDAYVSTEHASIEFTGLDDLVLVDNKSTNGTFVNGAVLRGARRRLRPGDEIRIGHTVMRVQSG